MSVQIITMNADEFNSAVQSSQLKILHGIYSSPFGNCLIGVTKKESAVCYLSFFDEDSPNNSMKTMKNEWLGVELIEDKTTIKNIGDIIFSDTMDDLRVLMKGTDFQISVWKALMTIPKGSTVTYSDIATKVGNSKAVRAAAAAMGSNRIGYVIPCHRVVSKTNGSSKYRWGDERRINILNYEKKMNH